MTQRGARISRSAARITDCRPFSRRCHSSHRLPRRGGASFLSLARGAAALARVRRGGGARGQFTALMIVASHWLGCVWGMCGKLSAAHYERTWIGEWTRDHPYTWRRADDDGACDTASADDASAADDASDAPAALDDCVDDDDVYGAPGTFDVYAVSLYFAIYTITSVGYGDVHPVNSTECVRCRLRGPSSHGSSSRVVSCNVFRRRRAPFPRRAFARGGQGRWGGSSGRCWRALLSRGDGFDPGPPRTRARVCVLSHIG